MDYNNEVMSVKDWLITLLVMAIPIIGFIMTLVWAFGGSVNENKSNMLKAYLLFSVIAALLGIVMIFMVFILGMIGMSM